MCLLNLPHAMKRFGPLRHLFEGSYRGEGYLRYIKANMKAGFKGNWKYNVLKKILNHKSMYHVKRDSMIEEQDEDEENSYKQYKYHSYSSRTETFEDFLNGKPISIVQFDDNGFGVVCYSSKLFLPITMDKYVDSANGHHYHNWILNEEESMQILKVEEIKKNCLLLPLLPGISCNNTALNTFTLINDNWEEIQPDGSWKLPMIPEM